MDTLRGEKRPRAAKPALDLIGDQREFPVLELPHHSRWRLAYSTFSQNGLVDGGNDRGEPRFRLHQPALLVGECRHCNLVGGEHGFDVRLAVERQFQANQTGHGREDPGLAPAAERACAQAVAVKRPFEDEYPRRSRRQLLFGSRQSARQLPRSAVAKLALLRASPPVPTRPPLQECVRQGHLDGFGAGRPEAHDVGLSGEPGNSAHQERREFALMAPERTLVANPGETSRGEFLRGAGQRRVTMAQQIHSEAAHQVENLYRFSPVFVVEIISLCPYVVLVETRQFQQCATVRARQAHGRGTEQAIALDLHHAIGRYHSAGERAQRLPVLGFHLLPRDIPLGGKGRSPGDTGKSCDRQMPQFKIVESPQQPLMARLDGAANALAEPAAG